MTSPTRPAPQAVNPPLKRVVHPSQRSILRLVWQELLGLFFGFVLLVPTLLLLVILLPLSLFAGWCLDVFIAAFLRDAYPGFKRLSPLDAIWLDQTDPKASPVSVALLTVQHGLSFQEIKNLIMDRVILAKDDNDNVMYPRFMQKIIKIAGVNAWVFDGDFDAGKHIVPIPDEVSSYELLRPYMTELSRTALPLNRPLWMLHVKADFDTSEGDTVLLFHYHQSLTDGISLVKILCRSITDKTQDVYHIKSRFGGLNFTINTIRSVVMASIFFFNKMIFRPRADWNKVHNPFYGIGGTVGSQNKVAVAAPKKAEMFWSTPLSLDVIDRISLVTRNALHNVLLSCLSGAIRSSLVADGVHRVTAIHASIPVDLRRPLASVTNAIDMGNQFVLLNLKLPTGTIGSIPRLWKIRQEEDQMKNTSNTTSMYWIIQIFGHIFPIAFVRSLVARSVISCCTIANIPGPDAQLFLEQKPIKSLFFWPPSMTSRNLLSVTFFTYAEKLYMAIAADPDVCDAKILATEFSRQIKDLSELLANRRAPGEIKRRHSESREPPQVLRTRILEVQRALLEAQLAISTASVQDKAKSDELIDQTNRVEALKEELMEMISMARRRKSVVQGVSMDFEEDEDMLNEIRSGMTSPRRRASSVSSVESVRVFAVTPTRLSGDARESIATSVSRSRTYSNMSETTSSRAPTKKVSHTVIYVSPDSESNDSAQIP